MEYNRRPTDNMKLTSNSQGEFFLYGYLSRIEIAPTRPMKTYAELHIVPMMVLSFNDSCDMIIVL